MSFFDRPLRSSGIYPKKENTTSASGNPPDGRKVISTDLNAYDFLSEEEWDDDDEYLATGRYLLGEDLFAEVKAAGETFDDATTDTESSGSPTLENTPIPGEGLDTLRQRLFATYNGTALGMTTDNVASLSSTAGCDIQAGAHCSPLVPVLSPTTTGKASPSGSSSNTSSETLDHRALNPLALSFFSPTVTESTAASSIDDMPNNIPGTQASGVGIRPVVSGALAPSMAGVPPLSPSSRCNSLIIQFPSTQPTASDILAGIRNTGKVHSISPGQPFGDESGLTRKIWFQSVEAARLFYAATRDGFKIDGHCGTVLWSPLKTNPKLAKVNKRRSRVLVVKGRAEVVNRTSVLNLLAGHCILKVPEPRDGGSENLARMDIDFSGNSVLKVSESRDGGSEKLARVDLEFYGIRPASFACRMLRNAQKRKEFEDIRVSFGVDPCE
ncbi:hypothetical protein QBC39DRAFT_434371 [Podospora conica]|nr:hypothetical protein QBC39DRAFT_434371 [Schizothecium conicum]